MSALEKTNEEFATLLKEIESKRNEAEDNPSSESESAFSHAFIITTSSLLKSVLGLKEDQTEQADLAISRINELLHVAPPIDENGDVQLVIWIDQSRGLPKEIEKTNLNAPMLDRYFDGLESIYESMMNSAKDKIKVQEQMCLRTMSNFAPLAAFFVDRLEADPFDSQTGLQASGVDSEITALIENYAFSKTDAGQENDNDNDDGVNSFIV